MTELVSHAINVTNVMNIIPWKSVTQRKVICT